MHVVEEPGKEVDGVGLVEEVEAFGGLAGCLLEELVRGDVGFEGAGVPDFADKDGEALYELGLLGEFFEHEEVSEGRNMGQGLDDYVEIIVFFNVVHANETCQRR